MLARVAENIYWMSRYLERVECTARLINVHDNLLMDLPLIDPSTAWRPVVSIGGLDALFDEHYTTASEANVTRFLISDTDNPSSIFSGLHVVRENLRSSRDTLSTTLYEAINDLYFMAKAKTTIGISATYRQAFLNDVMQRLLAITGMIEGSMSHDLRYQFLRLGCYLERADMTSRILDVRSAHLLPDSADAALLPFENRQWVAVLRSVSAFQMYLLHVRKPINGPDVLAYLLQDNTLPRAYNFCLTRIEGCLTRISENPPAVSSLQTLRQTVSDADISALATDKSRLHQFIDELQIGLATVGNDITHQYFLTATH